MKKSIKKSLALFTAATVLTSTLTLGFGTIGASAAAGTYSVGTLQDFESPFGIDSGLSFVKSGDMGNVMKFETSGAQMNFEFDEGVKKGKYLLSFDAFMSNADTNMFVYTNHWNANSAKWEQMTFMALRNGNVTTYQNNQWSFPQIGTATFEAGKWQRYDLVLNFDTDNTAETMFGELYVDGVYAGDINLTENNINAMNKVHFVFSDEKAEKSGYAMLDNFQMRDITAGAKMNAERMTNGIEISFSETMTELSADDFTVTRTKAGTTESENVEFTVSQPTVSKVRIVPSSFERGYSYTATLSDSVKTALNSNVAVKSVTLGSEVLVNKSWDFEDGAVPAGASADKVEVVDVPMRGKVLKYKENTDVDFKLDSGVDAGRYIYSYDLMRESKTDAPYMLIRAYKNANNSWSCFETLFDTQNFGNFGSADNPKSGWGCMKIGAYEKKMTDGTWYRIDNVMDMDNKIAYVYCDGEYLGTIDLKAKEISSFEGALMSVSGKNAYYDNIGIRTVQDSYGAKLSADGSYLYIDFDETTYLDRENITVTKKSGFGAQETSIDFTLLTQTGARSVLWLDNEVESGSIYTVNFSDVTSAFGTPIKAAAELDLAAVESTDTVVNDSMDYTADTVFAQDSPWSLNDSKYLDKITTDGGIQVEAEDEGAIITYDFGKTIQNGVIEMEVTMSANTAKSAGKYGDVGFVRQDGETVLFNEFNEGSGIVTPTTTSPDKQEYYWNACAYTKNTDVTLKYVLDFETKKVTIYKDGSVILNKGTYPWVENPSATTGVKAIKFHPYGASGTASSINVKNIKITHKYTSAAVGSVSFGDINGGSYTQNTVSAKANKIMISYPSGMLNDTFNGKVEVKCGEETLAYRGVWDKTSNVYTMTFDKLFGEGKTYSVTMSGSASANNRIYADTTGSFTTLSDGTELVLSNLDFTKSENGIDVTLNALNNKAATTARLIYAGYNGTKLAYMESKPITFAQDGNPNVTESFTDTAAQSYDTVTVFLWDGFDTMVPKINSVTK